MHLVQILLPLTKSSDARKKSFEAVLETLTSEFGGATAFVNSPAHGLWDEGGQREQDRIVNVEVMVQSFDLEWWADYRKHLEATFAQKEVVIRAIQITRV